MDPDPDPGGQKSPDPGGSGSGSGSGSSTLVITKGRGKGREERGRKGLKHREGSYKHNRCQPRYPICLNEELCKSGPKMTIFMTNFFHRFCMKQRDFELQLNFDIL